MNKIYIKFFDTVWRLPIVGAIETWIANTLEYFYWQHLGERWPAIAGVSYREILPASASCIGASRSIRVYVRSLDLYRLMRDSPPVGQGCSDPFN